MMLPVSIIHLSFCIASLILDLVLYVSHIQKTNLIKTLTLQPSHRERHTISHTIIFTIYCIILYTQSYTILWLTPLILTQTLKIEGPDVSSGKNS